MAATALIQFLFDATVGVPGQALVGPGGPVVTVQNSVNTDVASWQIDLVYVPPGSTNVVTVPYAFNDNDNTPITTFTPDVRGSYRWVLKVWGVINRVGLPTDTDIRNFIVRLPGGFVLPPYQKDPDPRPTLASGQPGAKPNEMNINGTEFGWEGDGTDGLIGEFTDTVGRSIVDVSSANPRTALTTGDIPFLRYPIQSVYDGSSVWVIKSNFGYFFSGFGEPDGWGFTRIDPNSNTYIEDHDILVGGDPNAVADLVTKVLWTGTQLFVFGNNFITGVEWCYEIIRGKYPTQSTFGPRTDIPISDPLVGATFDSVNGKIWVTGAFGNIYRFDPTQFVGGSALPEVTLTEGGLDIIFDPDTLAYPDGKPKLFTSNGSVVSRVTDLETLTPVVDASIIQNCNRLALGAGFLFTVDALVPRLVRIIREPLAFDISQVIGVLSRVFDLKFDPVTNKGLHIYTDTVDVLNITRFSPALAIEATVVINSSSHDPITLFPLDSAIVPASSLLPNAVFIPDPWVNHFGAGTTWFFNILTFSSLEVGLGNFTPRWGTLHQEVQWISDATDPTETTWDGSSDVIAINIATLTGVTINIGPAPRGKELTVVDVSGNITGANPATLVVPSAALTIDPLGVTRGSLTLLGLSDGQWTLQVRQPLVLPAGDLGGTLAIPLVTGLQGNDVVPGTPSEINGYLVWDGLQWVPRGLIGSPQTIVGTGAHNGNSDVIFVTGSGARTITFTNIGEQAKRVVIVDLNGNAASGTITLAATAGTFLGGTPTITTNFGVVTIVSAGGANLWSVESAYPPASSGGSFTHTITASTPFTITTEDAVGVNVAGNSTINLPSGLTSPKTIVIYDWSGNINTTSQISIVPPVGHNIDNTFTNGSPLVLGDNFGAVWLLWTNSTSRWILLNQQRVPNSILTTSVASTTLTARDQLVLVDSTAGARTVNLPSIPSRDQIVTIKDRDNNASVNNITIGRNGNPIDGLAANYILATNAGSVTLVWTNSTSTSFGWRIA